MKKALFLILLLLFMGRQLSFPDPALALSVEPSLTELTLHPGETAYQTFSLYNDTGTPISIDPRPAEVRFDKDGNLVFVDLLENVNESILSWIKIPNVNVKNTIEPGQKLEATFTVSVPEKAKSNSYYGAVLLEPIVKEENLNKPDVTIRGRVALLLFLDVLGDRKASYKITKFSPKQKLFLLSPGKIDFQTSILNDGDVYVRAAGPVTIENLLTHQVFTNIFVNPDFSYILPGVEKTFLSTWEAKNWLTFGFYKSQLILTDSKGGETSSSADFVVFPYHLLIIFIIIFFIVWFLRRKKIIY